MRCSDGAGHPGELDPQRLFPDPGRRGDVGAEDANADPAQAAEGREALAVALGQLDGRRPVGLDTEVGRPQLPEVTLRGEDDRDARHGAGPGLELRRRLARRQAADVDPGDPHTGGDPVRRAGEREPQHDAADHANPCERGQALDKQPARPRTPTPPHPERTRPRFHPQGAKSSGEICRCLAGLGARRRAGGCARTVTQPALIRHCLVTFSPIGLPLGGGLGVPQRRVGKCEIRRAAGAQNVNSSMPPLTSSATPVT